MSKEIGTVNVEAVIQAFFEAWARPKSYAGGIANDASENYQDRVNLSALTSLYAREANIDLGGSSTDTTSARFDSTIREHLPFITNGHRIVTEASDSGFVVNVVGWITSDSTTPVVALRRLRSGKR